MLVFKAYIWPFLPQLWLDWVSRLLQHPIWCSETKPPKDDWQKLLTISPFKMPWFSQVYCSLKCVGLNLATNRIRSYCQVLLFWTNYYIDWCSVQGKKYLKEVSLSVCDTFVLFHIIWHLYCDYFRSTKRRLSKVQYPNYVSVFFKKWHKTYFLAFSMQFDNVKAVSFSPNLWQSALLP